MNLFPSPFRPSALLGLLAVLLAGCADTTVRKTWTASTVTSLQFKKVLILAITTDDTNRRMAEVAVLRQIDKVDAYGSHEVLPDVKDIMKKDKVVKAVKDGGFDGVVVLRLIYRDTDVTYSAGGPMTMGYEYYYSDSSSNGDSVPFYQNSGSVYANRIFGIQTSIYDAKTAKAIWKGETKSVKEAATGGDVPALIADVAQTVKRELKSQHLIQ